MTSVRKSPNMMSTTGRRPVIAAPRAMPVNPGSEIGASITRSGPNSSTRPFRTLNGVPASATSSPMTKTVGSARISSASASFTAWPSVSSRRLLAASGAASRCSSRIHVLRHLVRVGQGRLEAEPDAFAHLGGGLLHGRIQLIGSHAGVQERRRQPGDRVPLALPLLFLLFRAVVGAIDVADVVAAVAVGVADQEARPLITPRSR